MSLLEPLKCVSTLQNVNEINLYAPSVDFSDKYPKKQDKMMEMTNI